MNALTENKKNQNKDIYDWEKHCKLARRLITGLYTYNPKGPDKCLKEKAPDKYYEAIRKEIEKYIKTRIKYFGELLDVKSITSSHHPIPWAEYLKLFSHVNESLNVTALQTILYHDVVTSIFENVGLEFGFFLYWHKPQGASQKVEAKWLHHLNLQNNIALPEKGLFWYSLLEKILEDMGNGWAEVGQIFEEIWGEHKVPDETSDLKKCSIPGDIVNDVGSRMQAAFFSKQMQFNADVEKNPLINIAWEILCRELVSGYVLKQFEERSLNLFTEVEDIDIVRNLANLDKRTLFEEMHKWLIIEHGELYFGIFQERMNKQYKLAKFEKSIDELGSEAQRKLFLKIDLIGKNNALTPTGKRVLQWLKKVCKDNYYKKQREWLLSVPLKNDGQKHLFGYGLEEDQIETFYNCICEIQRANLEKNYQIIPQKFAGLFGILFSNFDGKPLESNQLIKRLAFEPRLWDILLLNDPVRLEPEKNKDIYPSALIFFVDPLLGDRAAVAVSMIELPDDFASAGKLNELQQAWENRLECVTSIIHMIGQKCIRQQMEKEVKEEALRAGREKEASLLLEAISHAEKKAANLIRFMLQKLADGEQIQIKDIQVKSQEIYDIVILFDLRRNRDELDREIKSNTMNVDELQKFVRSIDQDILKYGKLSRESFPKTGIDPAGIRQEVLDAIKEIPIKFSPNLHLCFHYHPTILNIVLSEMILNAYRYLDYSDLNISNVHEHIGVSITEENSFVLLEITNLTHQQIDEILRRWEEVIKSEIGEGSRVTYGLYLNHVLLEKDLRWQVSPVKMGLSRLKFSIRIPTINNDLRED